MRWFFDTLPPNLIRGRERNHRSLPARREGWGMGYVLNLIAKMLVR
jgi:hypothetical protein